MKTPEDVRRFWLEETGPAGWYAVDDDLDSAIRSQFLDTWSLIGTHRLDHWLTDAKGTLAYLILADQFPRNMFRGQGKAFSTDFIFNGRRYLSLGCSGFICSSTTFSSFS